MNYSFSPLGDSACTVVFGNRIDVAINEEVLKLFRSLQTKGETFITDVVPAYTSLTVFYDPVAVLPLVEDNQNSFEFVCNYLSIYLTQMPAVDRPESRQHKIPVCYSGQFAPDLEAMAATLRLPSTE